MAQRNRLVAFISLLALCANLLLSSTVAVAAKPVQESAGFRRGVTLAGIREHQAAFQAIANANGGNRAAGTSGYDASVEYVVERLEAAGYDPTLDQFTYGVLRINSPAQLSSVSPTARTYVEGAAADFITFTGDPDPGADAVQARLTPVDVQIPPSAEPNGNTSACEAGDFAGFTAGNIALIQRGTCPYVQKAEQAQAAGAAGIILFNEGQPGRTDVPNNLPLGAEGVHLPGVGTSFRVGQELYTDTLSGPTVARVQTDVTEDRVPSVNVIAETAGGNADRTIVIGGHLDSVPAGPGINDNGSGSGTVLEIAETYAAQDRVPRNKIRFMWFGAEELGLLGSQAYVDGLSQAEKDDIFAMLNFDMLGSPNFVRFVYDGDGTAGPVGPPGSGTIENIFSSYFTSQGLASEPTPFNGRSDYGPFIEEGIPAGGLFSGAEVPKTAAQAVTYGGTAGVAYDPCYHVACDTFANVSTTALDQMSDAAAHTLLTLSKWKGSL